MKKKVFFEEFDSIYYFDGISRNWKMEGLHVHNQYEIILFMSDDVGLEIGNRIYKVGKGDIFFINNREYHGTVGKEGIDYRRYVLMFEPEMIVQMSNAFGYNFSSLFEDVQDDVVNWMHLSGEKLKKVEKMMKNFESSISKNMDNIYNLIHVKLCFLDLLNTLSEWYHFFTEEKKSESDDFVQAESTYEEVTLYRERVEQIKKYISIHVEEKMELDDIADHFYMNKYYLSHYFKKETGFTLSQYITNQKIMAAKKMLKSGMTVTDVAMRLSYSGDSHFISVFKKMTGITPKKYTQEKYQK